MNASNCQTELDPVAATGCAMCPGFNQQGDEQWGILANGLAAATDITNPHTMIAKRRRGIRHPWPCRAVLLAVRATQRMRGFASIAASVCSRRVAASAGNSPPLAQGFAANAALAWAEGIYARQMNCWLAPPWQSHNSRRVPLRVLPPSASRQRLFSLLRSWPLAHSHCWFLPLWQV